MRFYTVSFNNRIVLVEMVPVRKYFLSLFYFSCLSKNKIFFLHCMWQQLVQLIYDLISLTKSVFVGIFEIDTLIETLGEEYMVLLLKCLPVVLEWLENEDEFFFGKYTSNIIK